jgi:hypothetical protein
MSRPVEYLLDGSRPYNTSVTHNGDSVADLSNRTQVVEDEKN